MQRETLTVRLRNWLRQAFFWLPNKNTRNEERTIEATHDHALVLAVVGKEKVPRIRQLRHIFRLLTLPERRAFFVAGGVAVLAFSAALITFSFGRFVSVPTVGGAFTEAVIGEPKYLNPLDAPMNDIDRDLVRLIYSGLFRFDGVSATPDLAESYEWSNDRKMLTVHIRQDARFHDGQPVTAQDVQFTIESIQDPSRKSPLIADFRNITVSALDNQTVTFELPQPNAAFLDKLTIGILPATLWQDIPTNNARLSDLNIRPIGSGPYRVKSFLRDNTGAIHSYTLERFDQYYGFRPYLQTITFQFFIDAPSAVDAFKSELVDGLGFVDAQNAEKIRNSGRKQEIKLSLPQTTVAFFNLKDDTLDDKELRRALTLAVNKQDIVAALNGNAQAISGPFPFITATNTDPDVTEARTILEKDGWVLPQNSNVRIKKTLTTPSSRTRGTTTATNEPVMATASSTELAITLSTPDDPQLRTVADLLKRQWSLLGIKVDVNTMPTEELTRKATRERNLQVILLNILLGPDQDITPFWWSGQAVDRGLNVSNLKDRTIDDALTAAKSATSTQDAIAAQSHVSDLITAQYPAVFLVRPMQSYFIANKVHGVPAEITISTPADRFDGLEKWYEKTGWRWK